MVGDIWNKRVSPLAPTAADYSTETRAGSVTWVARFTSRRSCNPSNMGIVDSSSIRAKCLTKKATTIDRRQRHHWVIERDLYLSLW
jgi:hypothetical protein